MEIVGRRSALVYGSRGPLAHGLDDAQDMHMADLKMGRAVRWMQSLVGLGEDVRSLLQVVSGLNLRGRLRRSGGVDVMRSR